MKAIKTSVISILTIGLLAGSAVGAAAQEEGAEIETPLYYTWTAGEPASVTDGVFDDERRQLRGRVLQDVPVEASDPRFSGLVSIAINGHSEGDDNGFGILESRSYRVVVGDGGFTGSGTYVQAGDPSADGPPQIDREAMVLTGEGAYEGLVMFVTGDYREGSSGEALVVRVPIAPVPDVPDMSGE